MRIFHRLQKAKTTLFMKWNRTCF